MNMNKKTFTSYLDAKAGTRCSACIILMLCLFVSSAYDQTIDSLNVPVSEKLTAINKAKGNDILLRWLPQPAGVWLNSTQRGYYIIEKQEFKSILDFKPENFITISAGLYPWTEKQILERLETTGDSSLLIAGHCLYGDWESIDTINELDIRGMYNRSQELTNRYGVALFAADRFPLAAEAMGLRYTDVNGWVEHSVIYRISLLIDSIIVAQTTTIFDGFDEKLYKPAIKSVGEEEGKVILSWDRKIHEKSYTSYWIERSQDGTNFERLNTIPYIHAEDIQQSLGESDINYIISVENYDPYYYRIIGIDPFGDDSQASDAVKLMGRDRTPPPVPNSAKAYMPDETKMLIEWQQDSTAADLKAYAILYSAERDGKYIPMSDQLEPDTRSFTDYFPNYFGKNYYRICAIDTAGNEACTTPIYGFIQDTIAPSKPLGLKAEIDSAGVVTLHWPPGPERDIMGYNVYFSNRYNGVFSIISSEPIRDTLYLDTLFLNSLTREVFYRIVAVDLRNNTSDFSDMVMVMRPDTIPPGPAIFTNYQVREEGVYMQWVPSSSRDVVSHRLYRKKANEVYSLLEEFIGADRTEYLDSLTESGTNYTYRIIAIDASGLRSESVKELSVQSMIQREIPEIILEITRQDTELSIQYKLSDKMIPLKRIVLMKAIGDGPWFTWKTVENPDFKTIADTINTGSKHSYKAVAVTAAGYKTKYSPIQTVSNEKK
jgi:uncharacterized protein